MPAYKFFVECSTFSKWVYVGNASSTEHALQVLRLSHSFDCWRVLHIAEVIPPFQQP